MRISTCLPTPSGILTNNNNKSYIQTKNKQRIQKNKTFPNETQLSLVDKLFLFFLMNQTKTTSTPAGQPFHIDQMDVHGFSPLHYASSMGKVDIIRYFVQELHANPNLPDGTPLRNTALHHAIQHAQMDAMKILLSLGSHVNRPNTRGETPLFTLLSTCCADRSSLPGSCANKVWTEDELLQCSAYLLQAGADPNVGTVRGETALHLASALGNTKMVQLLLEHAAFVNHPDHVGDTPLHVAVREERIPVIQCLAQQEHVNINACNDDHETPLDLAMMCGLKDVAETLLSHGAETNHFVSSNKNKTLSTTKPEMSSSSSSLPQVTQMQQQQQQQQKFVTSSNLTFVSIPQTSFVA